MHECEICGVELPENWQDSECRECYGLFTEPETDYEESDDRRE